MVQYIKKYKKNIAIDMRKRGMSYSEIQNRIYVSKSTLSYWLKNLKLTEEQKKELDDKRLEAIKKGSKKKTLRKLRLIEEVKLSSAECIKKISKRELWLMGIVLYWRERLLKGNETDLYKGVRFTSSDPHLIKVFLKWLKDVGGIKNEEIGFDLFIRGDDKSLVDKAVDFWSDVTDFQVKKFLHIYTLPKNKTKMGLLRIRVKSSSMLARQIAGWVKGVIRVLKINNK